MRWKQALVGLFVGLVVVVSVPAAAQPAEPAQDPEARIAQLREMVLYAQYEEATRGIADFLGRSDLTATQRNVGLEVQAIVMLANRQEAEGQQILLLLYSRDPDHRLADRDVGPEVQAAFDRARDSRPQPMAIEVAAGSPEPEAGSAPILRVTLGAGADAIAEVKVYYRIGGEARYTPSVMRIADDVSDAQTRVPRAEDDGAYDLEYYVEALAPSRAVISTLGSPSEPLTLGVPARPARGGGGGPTVVPLFDTSTGPTDEDEGGIVTKWWFWTAIGVAVVAGVAGGAVAASSGGDQRRPAGSLGAGVLP